MAPAPTSLAHWGAFAAGMKSGDIASVTPLDGDTDPSPLLGNLPGSIRHRSRIATPAVRRGWLRDGPGATTLRGADEFVSVSWDELTELLASELRRVVDTHGNKAIYGGSYGWASAGQVPPRAEPGTPLFETSWRVYLFAALLQSRRDRRDHAASCRDP